MGVSIILLFLGLIFVAGLIAVGLFIYFKEREK